MTAMSEDDFVIHLERCNRCGWNGFEKFSTHSYCTNCNYSPDADHVTSDDYAVVPEWAIRALGGQAQAMPPKDRPKDRIGTPRRQELCVA